MSRRILMATLVAALLAAAPAQARGARAHGFAGLQSATTCIPGPIGGERTTSYNLSWQALPARSARAPKPVYAIFQATVPGGEDFSKPTYLTAPGATTFQTPALSTIETFYFVVRVRHPSGREDRNKVEREGQNLCL